jgi:hypothetical protein
MNLTVKKPVYSKITTATGATEPVHMFDLDCDLTLASSGTLPTQLPAEILASALLKDQSVIQGFLTEFLRLTTQYFAKPYTVANIMKTLKHDVVPSTASGSMTFQPKEVQISSKGFQIRWTCRQVEDTTLISLPDMEDELEEIDAIPLDATNEVIQLQSPNIRHIYDRQRVKEANLRAKLAQYKANRAHLEYLEKYGENPSDSSDSEPDDSDESE